MNKLVTDTTGRVWTECDGMEGIEHLTILHRNKGCPLCAELVCDAEAEAKIKKMEAK
jgi:hypothetical protein